jgi:hypothetical protein
MLLRLLETILVCAQEKRVHQENNNKRSHNWMNEELSTEKESRRIKVPLVKE